MSGRLFLMNSTMKKTQEKKTHNAIKKPNNKNRINYCIDESFKSPITKTRLVEVFGYCMFNHDTGNVCPSMLFIFGSACTFRL